MMAEKLVGNIKNILRIPGKIKKKILNTFNKILRKIKIYK